MNGLPDKKFRVYSKNRDIHLLSIMLTAELAIQTGQDNEILRKESLPVKFLTKELKRLIDRMHTIMKKKKGIGLAAPQVGFNVRIIIARISGSNVAMINPEILELSKECKPGEEGCLSLPNIWGVVTRPVEITVRFIDEKWQKQVLILKNLDARVVQHETDHLDGILFIDRLEANSLDNADSIEF